jgi:hypothetical protein
MEGAMQNIGHQIDIPSVSAAHIRMCIDVYYIERRDQAARTDQVPPIEESLMVLSDHPPRQRISPRQAAPIFQETLYLRFTPRMVPTSIQASIRASMPRDVIEEEVQIKIEDMHSRSRSFISAVA